MSRSKHHSLTSPGSAKSVWGSLHDQHPFPEAVSLLQLIKGVFIVVRLPRALPPPETPPAVLFGLFVRRVVIQSFHNHFLRKLSSSQFPP